MKVETITETVEVIDSLPLRLCFSVEAIRDHFECDNTLEGLTDDQIREIAADALNDDKLYQAFHTVLLAAVKAQKQ